MQKALCLVLLAFFSQYTHADICSRSRPVVSALVNDLAKKCDLIENSDLEKVKELALPHEHVKFFQEQDFSGLTNLRRLEFHSILHGFGRPSDPIAINEKVFAGLSNLEELIINDQLGLLPDGVFTGLTSLRTLDLENTYLYRLPASMLTLPKIEVIIYKGKGMPPGDYAKLKSTYGAKLQVRR